MKKTKLGKRDKLKIKRNKKEEREKFKKLQNLHKNK